MWLWMIWWPLSSILFAKGQISGTPDAQSFNTQGSFETNNMLNSTTIRTIPWILFEKPCWGNPQLSPTERFWQIRYHAIFTGMAQQNRLFTFWCCERLLSEAPFRRAETTGQDRQFQFYEADWANRWLLDKISAVSFLWNATPLRHQCQMWETIYLFN